MAISKKIWIGRGVLAALIVATIALLGYAYIWTNNNEMKSAGVDTNTSINATNEQSDQSVKLVKDAYTNYFKSTYESEEPDFDKAVATFKRSMIEQGAKVLAESNENQDPILCSTKAAEKLSYTEPAIAGDSVIIVVVTTMKSGTAQATVTVDAGQNKIASVSCEKQAKD